MDEKQLKKMLKIIKKDDADAFEEFVDEDEISIDDFDSEGKGIVYLLAKHGAYNILYYVLTNYEPEVNDDDGFCSALYVTDNEDVRSLLFEYGANNSLEDYEGMRFAIETIDWEVVSFDPDFRSQLIEAVIKKYGNEDKKEDAGEYSKFDEYKEALCFDVEDGEVIIEEKEHYDFQGVDLFDVVKKFETELSYDIKFEGTSWKLETKGVYFVD